MGVGWAVGAGRAVVEVRKGMRRERAMGRARDTAVLREGLVG